MRIAVMLLISISTMSLSAFATPPPAATRPYCSGHCATNWSHSPSEERAGYYWHCSAQQVRAGRVSTAIQMGDGATKAEAMATLRTACLSTPLRACYKATCSELAEPLFDFSDIIQ